MSIGYHAYQALDHVFSQLSGFSVREYLEERKRGISALERIATVLEHPLRECTTPNRVRNEAACCGNCPYFDKEGFPTQASASGACRINEVARCQSKKSWCGRHPDFWKEG